MYLLLHLIWLCVFSCFAIGNEKEFKVFSVVALLGPILGTIYFIYYNYVK